jgi:hypothetical protein
MIKATYGADFNTPFPFHDISTAVNFTAATARGPPLLVGGKRGG